jgi:FxLD family lantipeptide
MDHQPNATPVDDYPGMGSGLNLRLVDAGPVTSAYATNTDDNCGSGDTGSNACTTTSN